MKISCQIENWDLKQPFGITGYVWESMPCIVVTIEADGVIGRGEALGVFYFDETPESMHRQVADVIPRMTSATSRTDLYQLLPPGGARNALDCALWDLECKRTGKTIWQLTGIEERPVETVFTIGLEPEPDAMAEKASQTDLSLLKIKLSDDRPLERLNAIIEARPDARLVVDANQGWTMDILTQVVNQFNPAQLLMVEQPLARGADQQLRDFISPIPIAADESCQHLGELDALKDCYQMINIKLDKTGGLTEALALAKACQERQLKLMVGCMAGTSLSMAPAYVVAQLCDLVDIDGPLLFSEDRPGGLQYNQGMVSGLTPKLWG